MLLFDGKHEEATEWLKKQVKFHPLRKAFSSFGSFVKDFLNQCQDDETLLPMLKLKQTQFYNAIDQCCRNAMST